jgi:stage II sporulation protein AA (anti-sigma F factor antagonist)
VARAGDLEITVEALAQGGSVVRVDGELDLATKRHLEEAVQDADPSGRLVIDLSDCTFLDSSAVRVLISTARSAQDAGGQVALVASDAGVLRVLEIAAVDTLLPVHPTLDGAL